MSDNKVSLDLDTNRYFSVNAEGDKNTTLQLGVYKGSASWTVFANRQVSLKIPLPRLFMPTMAKMLRKVVKDGGSVPIVSRKWDQATSKFVVQSTMSINKDEKGIIYLNVSAPGFSPTKFFLKGSMAMTVDLESMTDADRSADAALGLTDIIERDLPAACLITNQPRMPQNGGNNGGNRGGGAPASAGGGGGDMFF